MHFDGHGAFLDARLLADEAVAVSVLKLSVTRTGRHGYLLFEEPGVASLLVQTQVAVLVLTPAAPPTRGPRRL